MSAITRARAVTVVALGAVAVSLALLPAAGQAGSSVLNPTDDSYTSRTNPTASHGSDRSLGVKSGSSERRTYLKFTVPTLPAGATNVTSTLRLWSQQSTGNGVYTVRQTATSWSEATLTWNNQPAAGATIASRTGLPYGYVSWDVTGAGTWAVVLTSSSSSQRNFTSKEGSASQRPQLVVSWGGAAGTAPTTTTGAASNLTTTTATLNGTVSPNGLATTCHFDWGTTTAYGNTTPNDPSPGSGTTILAVTAPLTGLIPSTGYHARLSCTNSAGTTNGTDTSFTTGGGGTAPTTTTGAASNLTTTTATLNGTVNPNGLATTCHFDWGTTTAYGNTTPNDPSPGSGTTILAVTAPLTGLTPSTGHHARLSCTNSAGTTNGTDTSFTTGGGGGGPCTGFCVTVMGNRLVDASGTPVQLRGVNRSGTQYACSEGWGVFDGPSDNASLDAMRTWGVNAVRVSLNDACWLGVNGVPAAYGGANYQNAIVDYVSRITAKGMYAIVDLHFANPGTTRQADQVPMADRDHANAFWAGVAAAFKGNPAVLFDLFNEPYPDSNRKTTAAWTCVRDGGTCPGVSYQAAGSQEMLNAIRGTGATNVVLVGGPQYAGVVDQWATYRPSDPAHQLAASIHIYYDTPSSPDWSPCYLQSCWESTMAPLTATTPVVIGEYGEHDCSYGLIGGTSLSPPQQDLLSWSDAHGVSYLGWSWFTGNCAGEPALISSYTGAPTTYGAGVRAHYLACAAGQLALRPGNGRPTPLARCQVAQGPAWAPPGIAGR